MKVTRYGGGESVVLRKESRREAQEAADQWNETYHTDVAYVERYDRAKLDWPDLTNWPPRG